MFMYLNSNGIPDTHSHPHQIDVHTSSAEVQISRRQLLSLLKVVESLSPPESPASNPVSESPPEQIEETPTISTAEEKEEESSSESNDKPLKKEESGEGGGGGGGGWSGWLWDVLLLDDAEGESETEEDEYDQMFVPGEYFCL
jgi:hypothetical protein